MYAAYYTVPFTHDTDRKKLSPYFDEDYYTAEIEDTIKTFNIPIEEYV